MPVILHTDHAARKLLPWIDGMLDASEKFYEREGKSLYSSHMLDLSEEPIEENLSTCSQYFKRMNELDMTIEIELGVTGGEEDGVDNTDIDSARLYTQPEEVNQAYEVYPRSATVLPSQPLLGMFTEFTNREMLSLLLLFSRILRTLSKKSTDYLANL